VTDPLLQAESDVDAARSRLVGTVSTVKARLSPAALKSEIVNKAQTRAIEMASDLADTVTKRPALTAGVFATAALIILRKPVIGVLKRLFKEK
jgi:hypothetical protein